MRRNTWREKTWKENKPGTPQDKHLSWRGTFQLKNTPDNYQIGHQPVQWLHQSLRRTESFWYVIVDGDSSSSMLMLKLWFEIFLFLWIKNVGGKCRILTGPLSARCQSGCWKKPSVLCFFGKEDMSFHIISIWFGKKGMSHHFDKERHVISHHFHLIVTWL